MARYISSEININRPPQEVWDILTDLDAFDSWNPFIVRAEGDVEPGAHLTITTKASGKTFTLHPKITKCQPGRSFGWTGRLAGVPGLFTGEHHHELRETAAGTRYIQTENFTGVMVPFVGKAIIETEAAFDRMNEALKAHAEAKGPSR
jgi:hypothetical protein